MNIKNDEKSPSEIAILQVAAASAAPTSAHFVNINAELTSVITAEPTDAKLNPFHNIMIFFYNIIMLLHASITI